MNLRVGEQTLATDKEGYLCNLEDWNPEVAQALAAAENITLTQAHWELIECIRRFYEAYGLSPAMRPLIKYIRQELGPQQGQSIYLMQLFPGSPAKLISKIAGLPRPENCL